jgi:hypothetical protein
MGVGPDAFGSARYAVISRAYAWFADERRGLISAAWLRVALSFITVIQFLWHIPLREAIWGPNGQFAFNQYIQLTAHSPFALYRYSANGAYFEFIYFGSLVVALLYLLGVYPRLMCWLFAITAYAIFQRNDLAADAGENLLVLVAWLLCLCDTGRYFALLPGPTVTTRFPVLTEIVTMLHNAGRFLIAWQICMVYFWAAFYKISGDEWEHGTAMYYVMNVERFQAFPWLSHAIAANGVVVAFMSYTTVIAQLAFPFLMWNQRAKPYIIAAVASMHLGIAVVMGLISFSATIIVVDVSLLSDAQFRAAFAFVRGIGSTAARAVRRDGATS